MSVITTLVGQNKLASSAATGGAPLNLTHMAFGDGSGAAITPLETMTTLVGEVYRIGLQTVSVDPKNANWLVCSAVVPNEAGPFTIREIGLFDADGDLIAIGDYPATEKLVAAQGVSTSLDVEMILIVSDTANVTVTLSDDTFATLEYVNGAIPSFATIEEHLAGESETKMTHPKGVNAMIDSAFAKTDIENRTTRILSRVGL
ncbi:phage tail protein [Roseibium sp.]|uniref:phage tail protein n=1 Tax=Roseibium sp. TaxID=1936156 RepID=UPI003B51FB0A